MSQAKLKILPIALGIASMSSSAPFAADAPAAKSSAIPGIEEVIITAQKTQESQQSVPISVAAFSTKDLEKQVILKVQDPVVAPGEWYP